MISPPYEQQGTQLDPALNVKGEWVIYEYIFLFIPPPDQNLLELKLPTGEHCFGFNAVDLAKGLQMSPSDLLINNRIGGLSVRWETGIPSKGATRAIDYIFSGPFGSEVRATVNIAPIGGSA